MFKRRKYNNRYSKFIFQSGRQNCRTRQFVFIYSYYDLNSIYTNIYIKGIIIIIIIVVYYIESQLISLHLLQYYSYIDTNTYNNVKIHNILTRVNYYNYIILGIFQAITSNIENHILIYKFLIPDLLIITTAIIQVFDIIYTFIMAEKVNLDKINVF